MVGKVVGAGELVAKWPWESYTFGEVAPDGRQFVYLRGPSPADPTTKPQLVVEELPTSSTRPIAQPLSLPRWSPDGRHLVFHSTQDGTSRTAIDVELYVIDADGRDLRRLTSNQLYDGLADW